MDNQEDIPEKALEEEQFGEWAKQVNNNLSDLQEKTKKIIKEVSTIQKYVSDFKLRIEKIEDDFKLLYEEDKKEKGK